MAAAIGPIVGGLLGAGGQVAGGLLGGGAGGQGRTVSYSPALDYALQASQYAGLDPLGFGTINQVPGPYQQLLAQLRATPITDRTRSKVFKALDTLRTNPGILDDPSGEQFTPEQLMGFLQDPSTIPAGRKLPNSFDAVRSLGLTGDRALKFLQEQTSSLPLVNLPRTQKILREQGLDFESIRSIFDQEKQFNADMQKLRDAGLGGIQTDTILNRANAAKTASELLGGAADFARTGQPGQGIGQDLFARDERQMADLRDQLGVMANFGGINPAQLFESLTDAKLDQNLRLIEQQLGMSNALQATLNPATAAASSIAGQGSGASMNAAQIAAQQAQAAAALRSNQQQASSSSLANGIAGGLGSLGSGIGNAMLFSSLLGNQGSQMSPPSYTSAGLNFDNVAGSFATPGVYGSGR